MEKALTLQRGEGGEREGKRRTKRGRRWEGGSEGRRKEEEQSRMKRGSGEMPLHYTTACIQTSRVIFLRSHTDAHAHAHIAHMHTPDTHTTNTHTTHTTHTCTVEAISPANPAVSGAS